MTSYINNLQNNMLDFFTLTLLISTVLISITLIFLLSVNQVFSAKQKRLVYNSTSLGILLLSIGFGIFGISHEGILSYCGQLFNSGISDTSAFAIVAVTYFTILLVFGILDFILLKKSDQIICSNIKLISIDRLIASKEVLEILNSKKIDYYSSSYFSTPFVYGLFRFKVVLPETLLNADNSESLKAVLAHESSHIMGYDSLWLICSHLMRRLLFFNPLVFIFAKRHREHLELAADEYSIRAGVSENVMSTVLLSFTQDNDVRQLGALAAGAKFRELKLRIQNLYVKREAKAFQFAACCGVFTIIGLFAASAVKANVEKFYTDKNQTQNMCVHLNLEKVVMEWIDSAVVKKTCDK